MLKKEEEDFVPRTSTGKQKSPNQIRNELQRYIDASNEIQTFIVNNRLGLNYIPFSKFMDPKTYKNQWSACQNRTYWSAARFLEQYKHEQKTIAKKTDTSASASASAAAAAAAAGSKKRKSSNDENNVNGADVAVAGSVVTTKRSKTETKKEIEIYMVRVMATTLPHGTGGPACSRVYDGCPEIVKKIKDFYKRDGVTKASFCRVIGNINTNSMNQFLMKKKQYGAGMIAYPHAYFFFERMRIMGKKKHSKRRLQNEEENSNGFRLETPRPSKWVVSARFPLSHAYVW
jgi:hypothetical protein